MVIPRKARQRNSSVINAGSMADIAFLLLIFFLVTTEIVEEQGLYVVLPSYDDNPPEIVEIDQDLTLSIFINYNNDLMIEDELENISNLKDRVYAHITDKRYVKRGPIVSFRPDRSTDYDTYLTAYNEILAAYNQLRDERSTLRYGLSFDELDRERKRVIADEVPMYLSEAEMTDLRR
ncbi:MAG: biopolymer transporter ExbD [Bacteroidota bacterium]